MFIKELYKNFVSKDEKHTRTHLGEHYTKNMNAHTLRCSQVTQTDGNTNANLSMTHTHTHTQRHSNQETS